MWELKWQKLKTFLSRNSNKMTTKNMLVAAFILSIVEFLIKCLNVFLIILAKFRWLVNCQFGQIGVFGANIIAYSLK